MMMVTGRSVREERKHSTGIVEEKIIKKNEGNNKQQTRAAEVESSSNFLSLFFFL
jgi:hypothetical protein